MLTGKLVRLRAVEPTDYELLWRWSNTSEIMQYWARPGNTESLAEVAERERAQAARSNSRKYIVETPEGQPIGQIDYYDLDWQSRSAWISIMIAEKEFWDGGYGTDAMRTLLRYLFRQLGLHRITLTVLESNIRAQRSYLKSGFVHEGILRDWKFVENRWMNGVIMSVLEGDFAKLFHEESENASG